MTLPWTTLDAATTPDGKLVLQRRGARDALITIDGRVLMNSVDHHSEAALGALACRHLEGHRRPSVLVGGLGMGITLRAALDVLPRAAEVQVAELNPVIERWCRGPIADLNGDALTDPRVRVAIVDFADALRAVVRERRVLDAILIDLYVGPDARTRDRDPLYGVEACERMGWPRSG